MAMLTTFLSTLVDLFEVAHVVHVAALTVSILSQLALGRTESKSPQKTMRELPSEHQRPSNDKPSLLHPPRVLGTHLL